MSAYFSTTVVNLYPMTRLEYNNIRGWELPEDECGGDEGYVVENPEGSKNHDIPEYKGYISWVTKEYGDKNYKLIDNDLSRLPDYQQRLVIERSYINENLTKLNQFIEGTVFFSLPNIDQNLLKEQRDVMTKLDLVLRKRLARFGIFGGVLE